MLKCPLELVINIQNGYAFKSKEYTAEGHFLIRIGNVQDGCLSFDKPQYVQLDQRTSRFELDAGDIVISLTGNIGRVARVDESHPPLALNQRVARLVIKNETNLAPEFLFHFLSSRQFRGTLSDAGHGAAQKNVSTKKLSAVEIPLPPFNEQRRIADKIDALQAKSRRAREALESVGPLLEKFRQSVLAAAFRGDLTSEWREQHPDVEPAEKFLERIRVERRARWEEAELAKMQTKGIKPKNDKWKAKYTEPEPVDTTGLPELPEGWCWAALEELAIHKSGVAYKSKEFVSEGIQVVKLGNLYRGIFDLSRDPSFLPIDHPQLAVGQINPLDLLVSQTGTRNKRDYGFFVEVPEDTPPLVLNQRVLLVRLANSELNTWVLHGVRMPWYRDFFFSHETGGVNQGNVGLSGVMRGAIPIGPESEMAAISKKVHRLLEKMMAVFHLSESSIDGLNVLDQSILAKAFRGELVPQDPNDEPASVLLERIKAERTAATGRKKTRRKA